VSDPSQQKERSHARIVRAASRLFRKQGYRGTSVDTLMQGAGLTRGGFYAHFESKSALLRTALGDAFAEARANLFERGLDGLRGDAWLARAAARYLTLAHREQPERGCAIPTLAAEVAREDDETRRAFEREVGSLLAVFVTRLGGDPAEARVRAIRHLAGWVGALSLARAVHDDELAREILDACRSR